jgi:PAS domain S-box-containing protein
MKDPEKSKEQFTEQLKDLRRQIEQLRRMEAEHKQTEQTLRESEARYKAIFETSREGILVADAKTRRFRYANPAICKMFGYTPKQMSRLAVNDIHPRENLPEARRDFDAKARGEREISRNVPCLRKDRTVFYADINIANVVIDNRQCLVGFFTDITEQKDAEEALRESERRYKTIFETVREGIIIVDVETKQFSYANPAVCKMFGYTAEEITRLTVEDIHPREQLDWILADFDANIRSQKTASHNIPCLRKDKTVFYADINTANVVIDQRICDVGCFTDVTQHKRDEEALKESEHRFRLLVEQLPAITYTAAPDEASTTLYVSPQVKEILGITPADYKADPDLWRKMLHPDDRNRVLTELAISHKTGQFFSSEYRMIAKDGRVVWVRDDARIIEDSQGRPLYLQGVMYDVTEHKNADEMLRQSEEKFRGLAERSFDMIFIDDIKGHIAYVSPACERIFGYKQEEMTGKHFATFLADSDIQKATQLFADHARGRNLEILSVEAKKKNGTSVFVEVNPSPIVQNGQIVGMQGIIRDITERKNAEEQLQKAHEELESRVRQRTADLAEAIIELQKEIAERKLAEESLRKTEQRFRTIFENTVVGLYRTTPDGRILLANPALVKMMGYRSFEEMAKLNLEKEGLDPSTPRSVFKQRIEKKDKVIGLESVWIKRDGTKLFVSESAVAVRDEQGHILYYEGTAQDITKRKEAEEKLLFYQKQLRSLASQLSLAEEQLRRRIATELHDHIAQNLAISKIKLSSLADTASTQERAESMREITDLIAQTIEETRSLTFEVSPPVLYELGLEAAVGWLARQNRQRFGLDVKFTDDGLAKPLDTNIRVLLFQAVRELLVNVVKHAKARKASVSTKKVRNNIRITVEDDGVGFDPSRVKARDYSKGGFGLFNTRERLDQIGGNVEIHSSPGQGTRIILIAPLLKTTAKKIKPPNRRS